MHPETLVEVLFVTHIPCALPCCCCCAAVRLCQPQQERQELAARQQSLLQLHNGRSLDLQQQQACAERLALVVRKERFLSQCLGTFVLSNCSVLQIAKLSQLFYPYSPQIAVLGAVLTKKRQEREEAERREQEQRRRRRSTHGLNIP
jgi:hypothetical protein